MTYRCCDVRLNTKQADYLGVFITFGHFHGWFQVRLFRNAGPRMETYCMKTGDSYDIPYSIRLPVTSIAITERLAPNAMALARASTHHFLTRTSSVVASTWLRRKQGREKMGECPGQYPSPARADPAYENASGEGRMGTPRCQTPEICGSSGTRPSSVRGDVLALPVATEKTEKSV